MKRLTFIILCFVASLATFAQNAFNNTFADSTLRLDMIVASNSDGHIALAYHNVTKRPGWGGRRFNLQDLHYIGNGQITMRDAVTDSVLYRNSFSTLFSEWVLTDLAKGKDQSMEFTVLAPLPHRAAKIEIVLLNPHHQVVAKAVKDYAPDDILIGQAIIRPYPHKVLHRSSRPDSAINVAILAEGYTSQEMDTFYNKAEIAVREILSYRPFCDYADRFNFTAIGIPSADHGVSVPLDKDWHDTPFGSHFSTFYSDRYLTTPNVWRLNDVAQSVPYDHIIVLANSPVYGGGGIYNCYTLTTAVHEKFRPVVVHEFGHSFAGLADEYFYENEEMNDTYPLAAEPWEPNITTMVDFDSKWKNIVPQRTPIPTRAVDNAKYPIGAYEGGGYSFRGIYRPAYECRMRNNTAPEFCPACRQAIRNLILFLTEPVSSEAPRR